VSEHPGILEKSYCEEQKKNLKKGNMIICQNFEKTIFAQMSITSLKKKFLSSLKTKTKFKFCPETGFSQFLSLAFKNCAASKEKCRLSKKAKNSKLRPDR
jgi:hypothetical protein